MRGGTGLKRYVIDFIVINNIYYFSVLLSVLLKRIKQLMHLKVLSMAVF